jgi:hypothetical protein
MMIFGFTGPWHTGPGLHGVSPSQSSRSPRGLIKMQHHEHQAAFGWLYDLAGRSWAVQILGACLLPLAWFENDSGLF